MPRGLSRPNRAGAQKIIQHIATTPTAEKVVRKALRERPRSQCCQHPSNTCQGTPKYRVTIGTGKLAEVRDECQSHALRSISDVKDEGVFYRIEWAPGARR